VIPFAVPIIYWINLVLVKLVISRIHELVDIVRSLTDEFLPSLHVSQYYVLAINFLIKITDS
jgi:hypothetical protein